MNLIENIKMAIESIKSNKMRSFLTMLGIVIGISSVIMIVAVGDGGKANIMSSFENIGMSTITLSTNSKNAVAGDDITLADCEALREKVPNVRYVSPMYQGQGTLTFEEENMFAVIAAGSEELPAISNIEIIAGRSLNKDDYLGARKVVLIDDYSCEKIFGTINVVGMDVNIKLRQSSNKFRIIGVYKNEMGNFTFDGMPAVLYAPITTTFNALGVSPRVDMVYIMGAEDDNAANVGANAINILEARHSNRGRDAYKAQDMLQQVNQINSVIGIFQSFIAAVAAISLLVGGIGVMNIMLVAVTERTREIGIRKALGAKTKAIMMQFLTESAIITIIGGVIGMVFGYIGASLIALLVGISPVFSVSTIMGTLIFSSVVGIFFGIYPAKKAARMSPIDALRHE